MSQLTKIRGVQIQDATATDGIINAHIKSDAAIAQSKIAGLVDTLASEFTTRKDADDLLRSTLNDEITARTEAIQGLSGAGGSVAIEATTRKDADDLLRSTLNDEITARTGAISLEATTRKDADDLLRSTLNDEITARTGAIELEATTRKDADDLLRSTLNDEITARTGAISLEATTRKDADDLLRGQLNDEITARTGAIGLEATTRKDADDLLRGQLNDEITARTEAIQGLSGAGGSLAIELTTRKDADDLLRSTLNDEITARTGAIGLEATTRKDADDLLRGQLNDEITARQDAISGIYGGVPTSTLDTLTEIATALGNDPNLSTTLLNAIGTEKTARISADDLEITTRVNAIAGLTASTGVVRTGDAFTGVVKAAGGILVDATGFYLDDVYIHTFTASKMQFRDPFTGAQTGTNPTFHLKYMPLLNTEMIHINGVLQYPGVGNDYTISGKDITFAVCPTVDDRISINYTAE